jgi:HAD superfamily hydrolase (TIGR01490 family)
VTAASAAFFDLDKTLIDVNSGRLWLEREWRAGNVSVGTALWAVYWLTKYSLGHGEIERAFEQATQRYRGVPEAEIAAATTAWFNADVAGRVRAGAREVVEAHRAAGDVLVLATSSTSYAAAAAAEMLGFPHVIATELDAEDGLLTGRIRASALGDAKAERAVDLAARLDLDLGASTFYTDSFTDVALMRLVGRPVAVHPDRRLRAEANRRGWEIVDWGVSGA